MEKRLLVAALLSLAVLVAWEVLLPKPAKPPVGKGSGISPPAAPTLTAPLAGSPPAASAQPVAELPAPVAGVEEKNAVIENGLVRATFSNRGAVLSSLLLLQH